MLWGDTASKPDISSGQFEITVNGESHATIAFATTEPVADLIVHLPVEVFETPAEILSVLAGKRMAVIGFENSEADKILKTFTPTQISSTVLEWAEVLPQSESLRQHDAFVLNFPSKNNDAVWLKLSDLSRVKKPIICIGHAALLLQRAHKIRDYVSEFLITPVREEELLLRLYNALSAVVTETAGQTVAKNATVKVVLADDDPTTVTLVSTILRKYDIECHIAQNGQEVVDLCKAVQPDAAIFDISLPYIDGFEVLKLLKNDATTFEIPVILLTARKQETDIMRAFALGTEDYITKPFNPMELIARLKRLLKLPA
ncbi:MAG: response regulator [Acidobacteriota bacterium]